MVLLAEKGDDAEEESVGNMMCAGFGEYRAIRVSVKGLVCGVFMAAGGVAPSKGRQLVRRSPSHHVESTPELLLLRCPAVLRSSLTSVVFYTVERAND